MISRSAVVVVVLCCAPLFTGCKTEDYRLELRPDGDVLQRVLYCEDEVIEEGAVSGRFEGEDEDRFGWHLSKMTHMGRVSAYSEQFAGEAEQARDLDLRRIAYNRIFDLWLAWFETEFDKTSGYAEVHSLIDGDVRADGWDLLTLLWAYETVGSTLEPPAGEAEDFEMHFIDELRFRGFNYLAQRGYFEPEELQWLPLAWRWSADGEHDPWLIAARGLATRMGIAKSDPLPRPLALLLANRHRYQGSAGYFFDESDAVRRIAEAWNVETDVEALRIDLGPGADSVFNQLFSQLFTFDLSAWQISQHATLHLPAEPITTNGRWDPDGKVEWRRSIGDEFMGRPLPILVYAVWSEPDIEFQETHFGKVVLEREDLASYNKWHTLLDPEQRVEWDALIESLEPGDDLVSTLQGFCFESERAVCAERSSVMTPYCEPSERDPTPYKLVQTLSVDAHAQIITILESLVGPC